jgi:hypothetical protein
VTFKHSVFAGTLGTRKSEASMATLPMPLSLAVRLKVLLASKHYRQNSQGLLSANRRGRPFSANKLREKKLRPLLSSLGISLAELLLVCPTGSLTCAEEKASSCLLLLDRGRVANVIEGSASTLAKLE